ncbi:MAG: hypothetical protein Fur0044_36530 [Anaerolineae bacterium]
MENWRRDNEHGDIAFLPACDYYSALEKFSPLKQVAGEQGSKPIHLLHATPTLSGAPKGVLP